MSFFQDGISWLGELGREILRGMETETEPEPEPRRRTSRHHRHHRRHHHRDDRARDYGLYGDPRLARSATVTTGTRARTRTGRDTEVPRLGLRGVDTATEETETGASNTEQEAEEVAATVKQELEEEADTTDMAEEEVAGIPEHVPEGRGAADRGASRTRNISPGARAQVRAVRRAKKVAARRKTRSVAETARRDHELTLAAPFRWNPAIDPSSAEFRDVYEGFRDKLRKEKNYSVDEIMRDSFTPHERSLLTPVVDRKANPALAEIQKHDAKVYSQLLRSDRFKDWAPHADLAFKFTMVFYGLPVAPMAIDFAQKWPSLAEEEDSSDGAAKEDTGAAANSLRWLNKYHSRMYGEDGLRRMLTPSFFLSSFAC